MAETGTMRVKSGLAEMLKGGVIMDVTNAEQARIAEDAGACAVMALERVPADIRKDGGVARMSDPARIREIQQEVTIPVMAKARIGHFVEAQVLQALEVDYIDESEVLTPADEANHINKWDFTVPFVCGATNLGEALRRIGEGAAMIRSKGEAGTGNVVEAVRHMRTIYGEIRRLQPMDADELFTAAKELPRRSTWCGWWREHGRLPVVTFTAGGIATPADAAMMMQLGADGVFVGSGIFKSGDPAGARWRSSRRPPTSTTRPCWLRSRPASASRWWAIEIGHRSATRRAARRRVAGRSGYSRSRGRSASTCGAGRRRPRGAWRCAAGRAGRPRRAGDPRRRVDHHGQAAGGYGLRAADARPADRGAPVFGTCAGHDPARPRRRRRPARPACPRPDRSRRAAQRLRPPGGPFEAPVAARTGESGPVARGVHPGALDRAVPARASRCSPSTRAIRWLPPGRGHGGGVPSRADRRPPPAPAFAEMVARGAARSRRHEPAIRSGRRSSTRRAPTDKKRGKLFTKLSRAIIVAAREGGGDPDANTALAAAVAEGTLVLDAQGQHRARDQARRRGAARASAYESVTYEGYGPERRRRSSSRR